MGEGIRFHETEQLFIAWPLLNAILESLQVDLIMARNNSQNKGNLASVDDYIYSMALGNKTLNDMPPAGVISDSTCNIAASYGEAMQRDVKQYSREWIEEAKEAGNEYYIIAPVTDKLTIAFKSLTNLQREILRLYYWENKVWKEVKASISSDTYKSVSAIKAEREKAVNKMAVILDNSMKYETYENIMEMVDTKRKGL